MNSRIDDEKMKQLFYEELDHAESTIESIRKGASNMANQIDTVLKKIDALKNSKSLSSLGKSRYVLFLF